jgi:hypothetical protein
MDGVPIQLSNGRYGITINECNEFIRFVDGNRCIFVVHRDNVDIILGNTQIYILTGKCHKETDVIDSDYRAYDTLIKLNLTW